MSGTYRIHLRGLSSLLMHADDVMASDELEAWRKDSRNKTRSKAGDDRSPAWTWRTYLYSDGEHVVLPAANLSACLMKAAAGIILHKQTTYKSLSQSGLMFPSEYLDFLNAGKQIPVAPIEAAGTETTFPEELKMAKQLGFGLDVRRARVGQAKHVRVRPRFSQWEVRGTVIASDTKLSLEVLREMFAIAGSKVGLGDWRPGCKTPGPFGMFEATVESD